MGNSFDIGSVLKSFRKHHGYYQKEVAQKLKISREYYSRLEKGKSFPSTRLLLKICDYTEIKIFFILNDKSDSSLKMCKLCSLISDNDKAVIKRIIKGIIAS